MHKFVRFIATTLFLGLASFVWAEDNSIRGYEPLPPAEKEKAKPYKPNKPSLHKQKPTPQKVKPNTTKPKRKLYPELTERKGPTKAPPKLSGKQELMRDAFLECIALSTSEDHVGAVTKFVLDTSNKRRSEWFSWKKFTEPIRGSPEHHGHEVCLSRAYGLNVFRTLTEIISATPGLLVPLQAQHLEVDESEISDAERRVARPWVLEYLAGLARDMHVKFGNGTTLRVTSGIRSAAEQQMLVKRGLSPADCNFEYLCSTHTSGSAVDLGLRGLGEVQLHWLQDRLLADEQAGKVYFILENSHFHVFVLPPDYMGEE